MLHKPSKDITFEGDNANIKRTRQFMSDLHLEHIRREYSSRALRRKDLPLDPLELVAQWLREAVELKVNEPTAVIVASATKEGRPSMRTVLLKEILDGRLIFYTNYHSRKGQQIEENPHVALTFVWHEVERQIHIEGRAERVAPQVSDAYFDQRPYKSRIGARISPQSQPIPSREYIMGLFALESARFIGQHIPRPESWGGFAVVPERIEFWQGRDSRLHDRFLYLPSAEGGWTIDRLAP